MLGGMFIPLHEIKSHFKSYLETEISEGCRVFVNNPKSIPGGEKIFSNSDLIYIFNESHECAAVIEMLARDRVSRMNWILSYSWAIILFNDKDEGEYERKIIFSGDSIYASYYKKEDIYFEARKSAMGKDLTKARTKAILSFFGNLDDRFNLSRKSKK